MFKKCSLKIYLLSVALVLLVLVGVVASRAAAGASLRPPLLEAQARIALQYIARREDISLDDLLVAHQHRREYPLLGRRFMAFTIFDRAAYRDFHLLVDLDDGSVVDDVAAVEWAEAEARRARYGKLHPLLYERLQTASDEEEALPVAIWVGGKRGRSREEVYALLARRYPQISNALARHANPFAVDDPALARQIRAEYERMRQEDIVARIQPLVRYLKRQGIAVETHYLLPSITATLSREEILTLVRRDDVQTVYLVKGKVEPELDTAVHTNRVAPVWSALGIKGLPEPTIPITIAVVEPGNVDWDNSFLHHTLRLVSPFDEQDHATMVASAAASFHDTYRGMAPGATILSAGSDNNPPSFHFALNWALDQGADVVNVSAGVESNTPDLEWLDRAFDYTARERQATIIKSAGNRRDEYITSPGKGWNVVTVGGINDQGNTNWSDDEMWEDSPFPGDGSAYLDPDSPHGDREKPEVAAPAQDIRSLGMNDVLFEASGTSLATPQVSGLVALLMYDNATVKDWPTAVKAILMASAMHNVEGDSRLSDEDGAGSIDANRAYTIAHHHRSDGTTCWGGSCWWAVNTTSTYPAPGGWLKQSFFATQGDLIRVAIAWWSEADPPPAYPTSGDDALTSKFNLYVWDPDANLLSSGYSASWDNNRGSGPRPTEVQRLVARNYPARGRIEHG